METYSLPCVKQTASGNLLYVQGAGALCQPGGVGWGGSREGGSGGRGYVARCVWLMLTHGRNRDDTVKQLASNEKLTNFKNITQEGDCL